MTDRAQSFENLRDRIHESPDIDEDDVAVLDEFARQLELKQAEYSIARKAKLLNHLVIVAEKRGHLEELLEDRNVAEATVAWINRTYENPETNRDYRVALRMFGKHVADSVGVETDHNGVPLSLAWISSSTSSDHDPTPDPTAMLRWEEDIQPMLDAARNPRDRAAVALQFDAGLRGGEYYALTVGSISDNKHGLQVTVQGKTGRRTVTLIPAVPYVEQWLAEHPASDDPEAPLWCRLDEPTDISQRLKIELLKRVAERAGVDKPATPTAFRKSSASHLASKGLNQPHLEDHHGWVRGSKVASRYVSVFADDADRELARVYGAEVEAKEADEIAPIECPRCGEGTPREKPLCVWCGQALEPGAAKRAEQAEDIIVQEIADRDPDDDAGDIEELLDLRQRVRSDPGALSEAMDALRD